MVGEQCAVPTRQVDTDGAPWSPAAREGGLESFGELRLWDQPVVRACSAFRVLCSSECACAKPGIDKDHTYILLLHARSFRKWANFAMQ